MLCRAGPRPPPRKPSLKSVEYEVGDEAILDGTTTVTDGGMLSYQWYQSGDGQADGADAAEDEKNDTLLEGKTGATLTVDTTEAGAFYYYVVATNTVSLADGTTDTASTTSNVAMVAVAETGASLPTGEGTEPGPAADTNLPVTLDGSGAELTSLELLNFTPKGETFSSNFDLLNPQEGWKWVIQEPYTLSVGLTLTAGQSNTMTLTLAEGMKFVNLDTDAVASTTGVSSAVWEKGDAVHGYQPDNGTLTVTFDEGTTAITLTFSIQPDGPFFPTELMGQGFLIENAIQVEVNGESLAAVDVTIDSQHDEDYLNNVMMRPGDVPTTVFNVAPGDTFSLCGALYIGAAVSAHRLVDKVEYKISVPDGWTVQDSTRWTAEEGEDDPDREGYTLWTLTSTAGFYSNARNIDCAVQVSDDAEEGSYVIRSVFVEAWAHGQEDGFERILSRNEWTIYVRDRESVVLEVTARNASNVYNYTDMVDPDGEPFGDYNTLFASATITNDSVGDVKQLLIYEAEFDQTVQFITTVGIPCGWDNSSDEWLPISITVTDEDDREYTITGPEKIRAAASLGYAGYGFVLRAEDIPGYDTTKSIKSIRVELPGLPYEYESNSYAPAMEGANSNNPYAGVWGRVREETTAGSTDINRFRIYEDGVSEESVPEWTGATTTITETGTISVWAANCTSTITVNGSSGSTASAGDSIHIQQTISARSYHLGQHVAETLLYDPVIYIMEPRDLELENVTFTIREGSTARTIQATGTDISNSVSGLTGGYSLYEYRLTEKEVLGWWDEDWNTPTLSVDFDYRVRPDAQTFTYDLEDLVFFKSALELAFRGSNVTDRYNLNDGNYVGGVQPHTFTVQAAPGFSIAAEIQIEGEDDWYTYDPDNPDTTTAVFSEGDTASVRVTVMNNTGSPTNDVTVYIPVPKTGQDNLLGDVFIQETGFDMYVAKGAEIPTGWTVQYGQVTSVAYTDTGVPDEEQITLAEGTDWSNAPSDSTNMIRLSLSTSMASGARAEITLRFRATTDSSQNDGVNIFKSWYAYTAGGTSIVDAPSDGVWTYNFGAVLQNGVLSGTVFADADRDGVMDEGEAGISGVQVTATDESSGRTYQTDTGDDGTYRFDSLPGDQTMTVTIDNPRSTDPNADDGSYRFSQYAASEGDIIGTDVTATSNNNQTASKKGVTLSEDGTATVNAGLIEPYTITFLVNGDGYVNPSSRKIYAGQMVREVTRGQVDVVLAAGLEFEDSWYMLPLGGVSTEVSHSNLLDQTVTTDSQFTAITSTVTNTVTAMWWSTTEGAVTQQLSETVDYGHTVTSSNFPADERVDIRPGYDFTGWSVNGTSTIRQRGEILSTPVTGAVNYIAMYTEKTGITVTLDPNGGSIGDSTGTATSTGTYGTAVSYTIPVREGYEFVGWAESPDATSGEMSLTYPAENTTYYAVWRSGTVRLTLLENGGSWATATYANGYIDGTVGTDVSLPTASDITRGGYTFVGWYVQGDTEQTILTGYTFPTRATTLIAKWTPQEETLTFDYGDASEIEDAVVSGAHGGVVGYEEAQKLLNVEYTGHTLTGWTAEDGTIIPAANTGSIVFDGDATYTAIWMQNPAELVFNAGEGASFPNGGQTSTYYGSAGDILPPNYLTEPEMEGKVFDGWYTEDGGGDKVEVFTFPASGSTTYYAHWRDAEYTVTFWYNGGTVDNAIFSTVTVTHGGCVSSVPAPTLSGSTLENWQNLSNSQTMSSEEIQAAEVTADVIYNAVWSGGTSYDVTFANYDGNPDSVATVSVTAGAAPVAPVVQEPEGQVFLYWRDNAAQLTYTAEEITQLSVNQNMSFTAEFENAAYTITFITQDGSFEGGVTQMSVEKQGGAQLAASDFPEVTGSTAAFAGWFYNGQTQTAAQWSGTVITRDMTFVAAFEGRISVSFDTLGGQWTESGQQYANGIVGNAGETMTLPSEEHLTRTGHTFTGWYTDRNCTTKAPDTFPNVQTTYYAGWSTESLSVTVAEPSTYDGTPKTPNLTVTNGNDTLTSAQYVAVWSDNIDAGDTASVTVYGIGEYAGLTGTASFSITKADQIVNFAKPDVQTATYGETFINTAAAELDSDSATISYSSSNDDIATVDKNGTVTILKAGNVTITATAAETDNVNKGIATYQLDICKAAPTLTFANSTVSVKTTDTVSNKLTTQPDGLTVTYDSSNPSVATVDENGRVTLVGEGETTITATFAGDEKYNEASATYTLTVDNEAIVYTAEGWYGTYNAQEHSITVNVTDPDTGATVTYRDTEDGDYTNNNPTYTNAGTHTVYFRIEAQGYDTVAGSARVIINKAQLTDATVTGGQYTGQEVGSVSEVKAGGLTVPTDSYDVAYVNNVNAGDNAAVAIITAKADSNFTGTVAVPFTITPKVLTEKMVSDIADQPYTGEQLTPTVTAADGSTPLVEGRDFTVSYDENNTVGTNAGTVTITGAGNYTGTVTKQFNITNSGTFEVIVDNSTLTYDGTEKEPSVTVWAVSDGGTTKTLLTEGTDYDVTYADNIDAGTASVTVTGKGAYAENGENWKDTTVYFTIQQAAQIVTFAGVTEGQVKKTYGDPTFPQGATVTLNPNVSGQNPGAVTYTSSNPAVATVDSDGTVTIVGAGTAAITASAAATRNYKASEASYTLTVNPKSINSEDVTVSRIPDQPYGGVPVTPDFSVTDSDTDITKHDLAVNTDYTFTYSDNNAEGNGKITLTGTGNYTGTREVTFTIIPWSGSIVTVTPAAITIYMGGVNGYDNVVVDEDTGEITSSSSLPEPGFLFTLPDTLAEALEANNDSAADLTFYELAANREWTVEPYAEGTSTIYRLVPGEGQDPVRVQFINAQGQTVTEDQFDVGRNVNQTLTMTLYKGNVGAINVIYDGVRYPIQLGESTLTVRGVTDEAQYAIVTYATAAPEAGRPAVTAERGTTYTINDSSVAVEDESGVALLFDSIIDAGGEDRTGLLKDRAEDVMATLNMESASGNCFAYSFQYLDLVDTNNGNAWVKASSNVTIYWPYPAGTDKETEFTLLHFEGLHREMNADTIEGQIANCTVSEVVITEKTDTHIVFQVGSAWFSPFALVWKERIPTYTITATAGNGGSISPSGTVSVLEGEGQAFTISASSGYHIEYVQVNGVNIGAVSSYTFTNVRSNQTIEAVFDRNSSDGGGHDDSDDDDEPAPDVADPDDTGVSGWLNTTDHIRYLSGYSDGTFGPGKNMTRAEVAQMFYNLLLDKDVPITVHFDDVADDAWYAEAVNTLASLGIVRGIANDLFAPDRAITRAEFTVIAMRFGELDASGENIFSDVSEDDWFYPQVIGSIKYGWINGYSDGTFRPDNTITRAEATAITNRMLGRSADEDYVDSHQEELRQFPDVSRTYWAYYDIMEAANAHDYDRTRSGEDWTRLH